MASARAKERLTPLLQKLRDFMYQRKYNNALRYADQQTPRNVQPIDPPGGVNHKLSANTYAARDGRRFSAPAEVLFANTGEVSKRIAAASAAPSANAPQLGLPPTPGFLFNWDDRAAPMENYWGKYRKIVN